MSFSTLRRLTIVLTLVAAAGVLPVASVGPVAPQLGVRIRALAMRAQGKVRAPMSFRLVGVTWPAFDTPPRTVRARTSTDGHHWSAWHDLDIGSDEAPDAGTSEARNSSTAPLWVGRARFVDVRWSGTLSSRARLRIVDPGPDPAPAPHSSAEASPGTPPIITRAQWGADESIRKCCVQYAEPLQMVFIHHTSTGNAYSPSDSKAIVRSIYAFHVQGNGWNDIGYNLLVDRYGQIFEGRYGGVDRAVVGAHSLGFNQHSAGIAVIGTFNDTPPTSAAMTALQQLTAWRLDRANVDPLGTTTMTSGGNPIYPAGARVNLRTISGHRDVYNTDCPGSAFYAHLPALRGVVGPLGDPKLFSPALSTSVITPNGDGIADSVRLSMRFSSAVTWTVDVVDPAGTKWMSVGGSGTTPSVVWNGKNGTTIAPHDLYQFVINAHNGNGAVRTVSLPVAVWQFPDGTLFRANDSGWIGMLDAGKLRHFLSWRAIQSRYTSAELINAPEAVLSVYPIRADIGFRDGSVLRFGSSMWITSDGNRRPVSQATLSALGYNPAAIIDTDSSGIAPTPQGNDVTPGGGYPNGTALQSSDGREALMVGGLGRPFLTTNVRQSYLIRDVDLAGPADTQVNQAQTDPPVGFRDGSLVRVGGTPTVYVIADGLRRPVSSAHRFTMMAYQWSNIRQITEVELTLNPQGQPL